MCRNNLLYYLKLNSEKHGRKTAIVCDDGGSSITYGQLYKEVIKMADGIRSQYGEDGGQLIFVENKRCIDTLVKIYSIVVSGNVYAFNDSLVEEKMAAGGGTIYVVCTSGTTGTPKIIERNGEELFGFIREYVDTFGFDEKDVFGSHLNFAFDASSKDLYAYLLVGATLHIISEKTMLFPKTFIDYFNENKITTFLTTPYFVKGVAGSDGFSYDVIPSLKNVMFVGENILYKYLNYWIGKLPQVRFVNLYGSSEIAGNSLYYIVENPGDNDQYVPLKNKFAGVKVSIVDGELVLNCGNVMDYKTGDLATCDSDGNIIITGRKDNIRKVRGYRISLEEIENEAKKLDNISDAVCEVCDDGVVLGYTSDTKEDLAAYIRSELKSKVKKYMVPTRIVRLESMPVNENMKISREKLKDAGVK